MKTDPSIAAIVLAAGRGLRFGEAPKLLAQLDGRPLVRHVAEAAFASRARPVLVVVGHAADEVRSALHGLDVVVVENHDYAHGLSTSLKAGFGALAEDARGAVVLLGDMPGVDATVIDALIDAHAAASIAAVVPVAGGRRGNPVLIDRRLEPEIAALSGDQGAGGLLRTRDDVLELPVEAPGVLVDIDTPAALDDFARRQRSEQ